jgi:hypothetical protein
MKHVIGNMIVGIAIAAGIIIAAPNIGFSGTWWLAFLVANLGVGAGRYIADA